MKPLLVALLVAIPGVAVGQQRACTVQAVDTTRMGAVYRDCDVDQPARLLRDWRPQYYANFPANVNCLTAELVFVVDSTGIPLAGTATVVRSTTPGFGRDLIQNLRVWRYTPATLKGVKVRQVVRERRYFSRNYVLQRPLGPPVVQPQTPTLFTPCS